jgi:hypothetical protein
MTKFDLERWIQDENLQCGPDLRELDRRYPAESHINWSRIGNSVLTGLAALGQVNRAYICMPGLWHPFTEKGTEKGPDHNIAS